MTKRRPLRGCRHAQATSLKTIDWCSTCGSVRTLGGPGRLTTREQRNSTPQTGKAMKWQREDCY